jgi:Asp-tRNA(Asn)/Glu-tRNA(Gln) amidotransferase A subunit family amidase
VPNAGHLPPAEGPFAAHETFGPVARCVADLELLFNVLADLKPDGAPALTSEQARAKAERDLRGCRVAWYTDDGVAPVTAETKHAVVAAAQALGRVGLVPIEARPPGVEQAPKLWLALFARAVQRQMCALYGQREELAGPAAQDMLARGADAPEQTLDDYFAAWFRRDQLRAELLAWMQQTPLVVAPVGAVPAFPHGARKVLVGEEWLSVWRAFSYAQTFNVFGLPVVVVPAGRSPAGLPVGVQIVGRPGAEMEALAAARIVETALGGWQPPLLLPTDGHNPL